MKLAGITDDGRTISLHFGRARYYLVVTVEDGKIAGQELREKAGHHTFAPQEGQGHGGSEPHGFDPASRGKHAQMLAVIADW
jgi:predicted Fe-Mo cluster-binding NifX family protein